VIAGSIVICTHNRCNRGLAEMRAAAPVLLDDDAVPCPGWLASHLTLYDTPAVACVGGRVSVQLSVPRP
jgi:hypothetical protein